MDRLKDGPFFCLFGYNFISLLLANSILFGKGPIGKTPGKVSRLSGIEERDNDEDLPVPALFMGAGTGR